MSLEKIIHDDDFTDNNGELHYFNTGRDNVSGLSFPNHYVRNIDNYTFTRILNIRLNTDTSIIYPIHECFLLSTYGSDNTAGITNLVNIDAIVKNGTVASEDIKITCTPLSFNPVNKTSKTHDIKASLKTELEDGFSIEYLSIWLNTNDIIDIITKDLSSLAYNQIPNNISRQFLQCEYQVDYLNNENVVYEVNMCVLEESIGTKIGESNSITNSLSEKIDKIETNIITATPDYKFSTIIYDDMYTITDINVDETITPTAFQYIQTDNSIVSITNDYIRVKEKGNYLIALKVNMDIHEGESTEMMMSLFLNDDRIEETTTRLHLDPSNKVYPLGFLSGQARIQLTPSDKLYLKARWSKKDNVFIENHCTLQITKLNSIA